MAAWKGYVNLMLDRTKYVGTGTVGSNKTHIKQETHDMQMRESLWGCGWHMRRMNLQGTPSLMGGGTLGEMI